MLKNVIWRWGRAGFCISALLSLLLCCSCSTTFQPPDNGTATALPADTLFNKGAGRGMYLQLTLHLENGEKLLFLVDTGCQVTILDKSLEPKLGKRLSSTLVWYAYEGMRGLSWVHIYHAPELYLGDTRLMTSDRICTDDLRSKSIERRPIMGILGMDCLKHYCLQLDFEADTFHFLDPAQLNPEGLGKAIPLTIDGFGTVSFHGDFCGAKDVAVGLDTGDYTDGELGTALFNKELKKQDQPFTNCWKEPYGQSGARFPGIDFGGGIYTNVELHNCPRISSPVPPRHIGLRFLARHLVTLNFPGRMMYLQQRSVGPLPDGMAALKESLGYVNQAASSSPLPLRPFVAFLRSQYLGLRSEPVVQSKSVDFSALPVKHACGGRRRNAFFDAARKVGLP